MQTSQITRTSSIVPSSPSVTAATAPVPAADSFSTRARVIVPSGTPALVKGMKGERVQQLQLALNALGKKTRVPGDANFGIFDDRTRKQLSAFQVEQKVVPANDPNLGTYGERTRAKMVALLGGGGQQVNLADPRQTNGWANGGPAWLYGTLQKVRYTGPLFDAAGLSVKDIKQGAIGDCFFMGSLAAVAAAQPDALRRMIHDNGDGSYTVSFNGMAPQRVDGDLYVLGDGSLPYARNTSGDQNPRTMELWVSIAEKAYAQARGGYDAINGGDWPGNALQHITGKEIRSVGGATTPIGTGRKNEIWPLITRAVDNKIPMTAYSPAANHTYGVVNYFIAENGYRMVTVKNPWQAPGIETLDLDQFCNRYGQLCWTA
jgi:hypothetical protein